MTMLLYLVGSKCTRGLLVLTTHIAHILNSIFTNRVGGRGGKLTQCFDLRFPPPELVSGRLPPHKIGKRKGRGEGVSIEGLTGLGPKGLKVGTDELKPCEWLAPPVLSTPTKTGECEVHLSRGVEAAAIYAYG